MPDAIHIVGAGRAGVSLAVALSAAGHEVTLVARRSERRAEVTAWLRRQGLAIACVAELVDARIVVFAVPDRALVAASLAAVPQVTAGTVWLHLSGAAPWQTLQVPGSPDALAAMHPLAALPDPLDREDAAAAIRPLRGATFAVAGTGGAEELARRYVADLAGHTIAVADDARPLYHAAAALAANDLVALLAVAERAALAAGLTPVQARQGLGHLMQTALDAVRRLPPDAPLRLGLTGAVARGDATTLSRHMTALTDVDATAAPIHASLSLELVTLMRDGGPLGPAVLAAMEAVLAATIHPGDG